MSGGDYKMPRGTVNPGGTFTITPNPSVDGGAVRQPPKTPPLRVNDGIIISGPKE
jgi:hypothetical protein